MPYTTKCNLDGSLYICAMHNKPSKTPTLETVEFVRTTKDDPGIDDPFHECCKCKWIGQGRGMKQTPSTDSSVTELCCPKCLNADFYVLEPKK